MMPRSWTKIPSSHIDEVYHDGKDLHVKFHAGGTYKFHDVPEDVATDLVHSSSSGRYFKAHIKNNYAAEKID